ncbi:ABC transporter permease [Dyella flava]|uniref:Transport permease protein n=1 Tax=Dyella flava TaxID=1920170 RepID=A0ABS2K152_9GAMM|nr:ABC transporter permease [Dyella flava]MBM7124609.1 ABC transporter permease [Dyella flava]GLQ49262.1 transport permease protein [Dyella flava]
MDPHISQPTSPWAMVKTVWRHRTLITQMTVREVVGRYRGSFMGLTWSFFNPLLMLLIYTFVFTTVFHSRWGTGQSAGKVDFAIVLFVGMIVYAIFAENINRAPMLIVMNVNYVKRVVFPLEVLPVIAMGASIFHCFISLLVWLLAYLFLVGVPHLTALLFPLVILPFVIGILGATWFLASLGVFLRDVAQTTGIITTALMFLAPVFYSIDNLPPSFKAIILVNPATFIIEQARYVLVWGRAPDWLGLGVYTLISATVAWLGYWWFQKTRKGFADVL